MDLHITQKKRPKAILVGVQLFGVEDADFQASFAELSRLVDTLGFEVLATITQQRRSADAATVIGRGKLKELSNWTKGSGVVPSLAKNNKKDEEEELVEEESEEVKDEFEEEEEEDLREIADVVIFNQEITPTQLRNLELATKAEILDRSGVIIEIFHRHAKTKEARLQVEIAKLKYMAPRLRMSQKKGGDRQAGGVGAKGAGETAHELNRRRIRDRIAELTQQLNAIAKEDANRRERRRQASTVALVGYTNAGKSSLMRRLTSDASYVADKLFATLGTTVRVMQPETKPKVLISDTVGFIKELPHDLVASFRSTLDEAHSASLLLHAVDASDPDFRSQIQVTTDVLGDLKAHDVPRKMILNKIDLLEEEEILALREEFPEAILMAAHRPADIQMLKGQILNFFEEDMVDEQLHIPYHQGKILGEVHKQVRVLHTTHDELGTQLLVRGHAEMLQRLREQLHGNP